MTSESHEKYGIIYVLFGVKLSKVFCIPGPQAALLESKFKKKKNMLLLEGWSTPPQRRQPKKTETPLPFPSPPHKEKLPPHSVSALRRLVAGSEVLLGVLAQPHGQLGDLLSQAVCGLHIHVGLSNQLRHGAYKSTTISTILNPHS